VALRQFFAAGTTKAWNSWLDFIDAKMEHTGKMKRALALLANSGLVRSIFGWRSVL
jgi:hypothetical protein